MDKKIHFGAVVCINDIIFSLVENLDNDEMVQFIIDLDVQCLDLDVTEKLYKHFNKEMKKFKKEKGKTSKEND